MTIDPQRVKVELAAAEAGGAMMVRFNEFIRFYTPTP